MRVAIRHLWGLKAGYSLLRRKKVGFEVWLLTPPLTSHGTSHHLSKLQLPHL